MFLYLAEVLMLVIEGGHCCSRRDSTTLLSQSTCCSPALQKPVSFPQIFFFFCLVKMLAVWEMVSV